MEIVKASVLPLAEVRSLGKIFADSGIFANVKTEAQAIVRILAGQEIGIPPFAAISGISIIKEKTSIGAGIMASSVKGSGKYDYKVKEHTDKICSIDFFQKYADKFELVGNSTFTIEDAKKAGTQNLDKFPRNMLFARAMSNGVKWHTPDIFSGPVYVPEEMANITEDTTAETTTDPGNKAATTLSPWSPSTADLDLAASLIKSSTLDDNKQVIAANSISNAKNQKELDKLINRLREAQVAA